MRLTRSTMTAVLAGATLFGASTAAQAADIIIDDFNTDFTSGVALTLPGDSAAGTNVSNSAVDPSSIIGGQRGGSLTVDTPGNSSGQVQATVSGGTLDIAAPPVGPDGLYDAVFTYDGGGSGLSADLTDGGTNDRFIAIIDENDFPVTFEITLSDGTNTDTFSGNTPGGIAAGDPPFLADVPFADFPNFGTPTAVDFTSLDSIELAFNFGSSGDLSLDLVATSTPVPVPATFGLLGAGLIGLGLVARRRARV